MTNRKGLLSDPELKVLQALESEESTSSLLSNRTGVRAGLILNNLKKNRLVTSQGNRRSKAGETWFISQKGIEILDRVLNRI